MKIKKGDKVMIMSGKDRGKTGTIVRALPKSEARASHQKQSKRANYREGNADSCFKCTDCGP
jgi:ribosomal protein L24